MDQTLITEQTLFPVVDIDVVGVAESNYANYQSSTATNGANALIDIMENIIVLVGNETQD